MDKNLEEMLNIYKESTPGNWIYSIEGDGHWGGSDIMIFGEGTESRYEVERLSEIRKEDLEFIVNSRKIIESLLEKLGADE